MQLDLVDLVIHTPAGRPLLSARQAEFGVGLTALIGSNGAGKSTLLRTIFGLHPLASGRIVLGGVDSRRERRQFLAMSVFQPQNFVAYPELDGVQFLSYCLSLRGFSGRQARSRAGHWFERVGLAEAAGERIAGYSQGMLQRLGLAYALQLDTALCVLDEPFAGVDPQARQDLGQRLAEAARDRVVLICTHHVDEMQAIGAGVAEIRAGQLSVGLQPQASL
ncbi:MAG TPA: ATP-binding cassette domain-containing protein [Burkholderiaceae bacterium]|jgi:ABC-2 type transport system ATP-binding protein